MRRPISQKLIARSAVVSTVCLALVCGALLYGLVRSEHDLVEFEHRREETLIALEMMTHSAEAQSARAQNFVGSQDANYSDQYWNEINVTKEREAAVERLRAAEVPDDEMRLMEQALEMAQDVQTIEIHAMRLVFEAMGTSPAAMPPGVAQFQVPADDTRLSADEKIDRARELIYGNTYDASKGPLLMKLGEFYELSNTRTRTVLNNQENLVNVFAAWLAGLLTLLTIAAVGSLLALNKMVGEVVRDYTQRLTDRDPKDLTFSLKPRGAREVTELAKAFNAQTGQMNELLVDIRNSADSLAEASSSMLHVASGMTNDTDAAKTDSSTAATSAETVRDSVDAVSAATTQMGSSIEEISQEAARASDVAQSAVTAAESTTSTMARLSDSSKSIGDVVQTITALASQTNLLALNATIEAARAGDAGKGFAVVASEVKELARQTGEATENITARVESIQNDTDAATVALGEIAQVIGEINSGQSTIASAVEEQSVTTQDINRSINEAAGGVTGIAAGITSVSTSANNAAQGAHRTLEAAKELGELAERFKEVADSFETA